MQRRRRERGRRVIVEKGHRSRCVHVVREDHEISQHSSVSAPLQL